MNNHLFAQKEIDTLIDVRKWRYVCPPQIADVQPLEDHPHCTWMQRNSHQHRYIEVLFVLEGNGVFGCAGKVYPAETGTAFIINSYTEHDLFYSENASAFQHMWMFVFPDRCIYQRVSRVESANSRSDKIQLLAHVDNSHGASLLYENSVGDSLLKLQVSLASLIYSVIQAGYANQESFQEEVIDAICKHIQDTAGKGVTLDTLARISGYSKYHFLRLFKQHTGKNVHEYIDICRQKRVVQLRSQGLYKKQIAAELGFSCLAAYSRWCKSKGNN